MDFTKQGLTYIFLILPTLVALGMCAQGYDKTRHRDQNGTWILTTGILLIVLIIGTYFFIIR